MAKTDPIDISSPPGSQAPKLGDDAIRRLARAVIEILEEDHYVGTATNSQYDEDDAGKHRRVTFRTVESSDPTIGTNDQGVLYQKGTPPELFYRDSDDNVVQLTSTGVLHGTSIRLANNVALRGRNVADSADINIIKVNDADGVEIPGALKLGGKITNVTDPVDDQDAATKKYVADQVAAETTSNAPAAAKAWLRWTVSGTTYTIQDSYNVTSLVRNAQGQLTVTFTTPFANTHYAVAGTAELERHMINDMVRATGTYKFRMQFGTDIYQSNESNGSLIFMGTQ